mmetsp:Transcript_27822/g.75438  ORF Transcript_27822/g.75438 Transcript_27822/m.75438 type:complete len:224 (+) Transcript_27822:723-1394(+)
MAGLDVLDDHPPGQPQDARPHAGDRLGDGLAVAAVHAHPADVVPGLFARALKAVAVAEDGRRGPPLLVPRSRPLGCLVRLLSIIFALPPLPPSRAVLPFEDLHCSLVLLHEPLLEARCTPNGDRPHGVLHILAEAVQEALVLEDPQEPSIGVTYAQLMRPNPPLPLQRGCLRRGQVRMPLPDLLEPLDGGRLFGVGALSFVPLPRGNQVRHPGHAARDEENGL